MCSNRRGTEDVQHLFHLPTFPNHVLSIVVVWRSQDDENKNMQFIIILNMSSINSREREQQLTGEFCKPSDDLHNKVAPHKSIKVPSCKIFVSSLICYK